MTSQATDTGLDQRKELCRPYNGMWHIQVIRGNAVALQGQPGDGLIFPRNSPAAQQRMLRLSLSADLLCALAHGGA